MNLELITQEQLQELNRYVNKEEGAQLSPETASGLFALAMKVGGLMATENRNLRAELKRANAGLERVHQLKKEDNKALVDNNEFDALEFSALQIAKAFLYCLQRGNFYLSKKKFECLLYLLYCSVLYHKKLRICYDQPQALEGGAVFWTALRANLSVVSPVSGEEWNKLTSKSTAVAGYIKDFCISHGNSSEKDLVRAVMTSQPYKDAWKKAQANNTKKWTISDKDIWYWREQQAQLKRV